MKKLCDQDSGRKNFAKIHDPNFREGRPQKFTEEQIQFAHELIQQGMAYKMIERKTGISIATQKRRFSKISLLKNDSAEKIIEVHNEE